MFVILVGGGRTGSKLAQLLIQQGHRVNIIESRPDVLTHLHQELPTEMIYEGVGHNQKTLERVGIQKADVLAAVTRNDDENLLLCYMAREKYHVSRTIARVNNPKHAWLFNDLFNVDVSVNHAEIMSRLISEEMSMGDMMTLLKLRRGDYSLVEEKIPEGSRVLGVAIKDLGLTTQCVIAGIIRHGELILPRGNTCFEQEDEVLAVVDSAGARELSEKFSSKG